MKEPGLTAQLSDKSQVDRYFVTNQIKSIAMKASIIVNDAKVHELTQALKEANCDKLRKLQLEEDSEDDEALIPLL